MTYIVNGEWSQTDPATYRRLQADPNFRWHDDLAPRAFWGPSPAQILKTWPDILLPGMVFSSVSQSNANAIDNTGTFWVVNPSNRDFGIWGLNAYATGDMVRAQQANAPMCVGFYGKIAGRLPPFLQIQQSAYYPGGFQPGFDSAYLGFFPGQAPPPTTPGGPGVGPGSPGQAPPPGTTAGGAAQTWELIGRMNGQLCPVTSAAQKGPQGWSLLPGGAVTVGNSPQDGNRLAGTPGMWGQYSGGQPPEVYGLDPGKGVLAMAMGNNGVLQPYPVYANVLQDMLGPNWRAQVYR